MTPAERKDLLAELKTATDRRAREIVALLWTAWPSDEWMAEHLRECKKGRRES